MRSLEGQTALVCGGGSPIGRAIALALSARGVRIVVTGRDEKALGETVGEIAHGGGKARHLAGDLRDPLHVKAAVDRAIEVFGALDLVIHADPIGAECTLSVALPRVRTPGRLLVAMTAADPVVIAAVVREPVNALFARGITCNAVVLEGASTEDAVEDAAASLAEVVVFLCGAAADRITGQALAVRAPTGAP
jgi:2-polyprenyl-6-methoxyphenol hydroxylase-like FAD-dependent oxidoreductase